MTHTLTTTDDSIVSGNKYRYRIKSVNAYGSSEYSQELSVSIAPLPSAPDAVTKDESFSSKTSMMIQWIKPNDVEPIIGYKLYMIDDFDGTVTNVYDGSSNPNIVQYFVDYL